MDMKMDIYKPRREAWNRSLTYSPQKELTLLTPWFWTSSLQNCERTNFCGFSHPVCAVLLWQPLQIITRNLCLNSTEELSWSEPGWVVSQGAYVADIKLPGRANYSSVFPRILDRLSVQRNKAPAGRTVVPCPNFRKAVPGSPRLQQTPSWALGVEGSFLNTATQNHPVGSINYAWGNASFTLSCLAQQRIPGSKGSLSRGFTNFTLSMCHSSRS